MGDQGVRFKKHGSVADVKRALDDLVREMNSASTVGYKFDFQIVTDHNTMQSSLAKFEVFQRVTIGDTGNGHH